MSLRKFLDILIGMHNDLVTNVEVIDKENLRDYVVAATLKNAHVFTLQLQEYTSIVELALETMVGDFKEMKVMKLKIKLEGKELMKKMRLQIKAATSLKDGPKASKGKKRKGEVDNE